MDKKISIVLIGLIIVVLILGVVVLYPFENSVVTSKTVVNSEGVVEQVGMTGDSEVIRRNIKSYCYKGVGQERFGGNCDYPVNEDKRCYKTVRRGCEEVKIEVSCFDEVEQVRGEGGCFPISEEKRCYKEVVDGCNVRLVEVSCFEDVDQVRYGGNCGYPENTKIVCDGRDSRSTCY